MMGKNLEIQHYYSIFLAKFLDWSVTFILVFNGLAEEKNPIQKPFFTHPALAVLFFVIFTSSLLACLFYLDKIAPETARKVFYIVLVVAVFPFLCNFVLFVERRV